MSGRLNRSRFRARPASQGHHLVRPRSTLILGLICFAFCASLAVISNVWSNKTTTWWTTATFVGFALLSLPLVYLYFLEDHEISDEGLIYKTLIGRRKSLRWSELCAVRYAPVMKWFRLETRTGNVARISVMLMGLPEFARLLLQRAPASAIEASTVNVLRDTAAGNLPAVWN